jgi:hypothetical protein
MSPKIEPRDSVDKFMFFITDIALSLGWVIKIGTFLTSIYMLITQGIIACLGALLSGFCAYLVFNWTGFFLLLFLNFSLRKFIPVPPPPPPEFNSFAAFLERAKNDPVESDYPKTNYSEWFKAQHFPDDLGNPPETPAPKNP